jgi:hypothetical protein
MYCQAGEDALVDYNVQIEYFESAREEFGLTQF